MGNYAYHCTMYSSELIKGTLKVIILKLLADGNRMYGYELSQKVTELTAGKIELKEGALYPILHKLEADGLVTVVEESFGKRIRKYYSLTGSGKNETNERVEEILDFIKTIESIMKPRTVLGI